MKVEIYFEEYKKRMLIDVIGGQKQRVILGMPQLAHHNPEIDQGIGEVQMTRYLEECGKKQRIGRQTKPGWQKQEEREEQKEKREKEKREEFRRLTIEEEIAIARIVEEKEEDLIELRIVEEMVPRQFHKYLKMFEKKESERMLMRKTRDHVIDLREGFMPKRGRYIHCQEQRERKFRSL